MEFLMNNQKITPEFLKGYLKAIEDIENFHNLWSTELWEECPIALTAVDIIKHLEFKEVRYRNDSKTK